MAWDAQAASQLGGADEITVVVPAPDRSAVRAPIWIVTVDGDLYVRSWKGEAGRWYRRARRYATGSVIVAGREYPVRFVPAADPDLDALIDQEYLRKYGRNSYSGAMTQPPAASTTLRLEPAS